MLLCPRPELIDRWRLLHDIMRINPAAKLDEFTSWLTAYQLERVPSTSLCLTFGPVKCPPWGCWTIKRVNVSSAEDRSGRVMSTQETLFVLLSILQVTVAHPCLSSEGKIPQVSLLHVILADSSARWCSLARKAFNCRNSKYSSLKKLGFVLSRFTRSLQVDRLSSSSMSGPCLSKCLASLSCLSVTAWPPQLLALCPPSR